MLLGNLLKNIKKKYSKIPVTGISFDSRKTKRGNIFFSIDGHKTSGSKYIMEALARGASAVVSNKKIKYINSTSPLILVKDVRKSLSEACSKIYKEKPKKCIIAVTGTNGKSSVADFFCQILNFNKLSVASIGTLGIL
jgi:MurE/MurF fusion protein